MEKKQYNVHVHVNLIIITHACADILGVLFAIINTTFMYILILINYSGMSLLFSQMLELEY